MNETSYTITHAGYRVNREAARFTILDESDATKKLPVTDGIYESTGVRVDTGNVWLGGTLVVRKGRALCFAAAYGDYTFIRRAGKDVIEVEGPGISAPMKWDSPFRTSTPGYKHVIMQGGIIDVGGECIVRQGALFGHGIQMPNLPADTSSNHNNSRLTDLQELRYPVTNNDRTYSQPEEVAPLFCIKRRNRCITRFPEYFRYDGPLVFNKIIGLGATDISSNGDHAFKRGNAWILGEQVIKDRKKLEQGMPRAPAPQVNMDDFWK